MAKTQNLMLMTNLREACDQLVNHFQVRAADRDVRAGGDDALGPDHAGAGQGVQSKRI